MAGVAFYDSRSPTVLTQAEVLLRNARALALDITRPPSFIKNLYFRTADFVLARNRKPSLEMLLPVSSPAPTAKGVKGAVSKIIAGFFRAKSEFGWYFPSPSPFLQGMSGGLRKKPEELDYD